MGTFKEMLLAFYVPITVLSAVALYLYTKAVLWPALKSKSLTIKDHGLALALAAGFFGDLVENTYYGIMRVLNLLSNTPHYTVQPVLGIKIAVLATSIIGLAAYGSIVKGRDTLAFWTIFAGFLWAISFLVLYVI